MKAPSSQRIVVVGRGIAGAFTAWRFHRAGCDVAWWGNGAHSASRVAAGMFNPVSFRHVLEVWNAEAHVAAMKDLLSDIVQVLELPKPLVHDVSVIRIFPNVQYREDWQARIGADHNVSTWIGDPEPAPGHVHAPHGCGRVVGSGWVNIPLLLDALGGYFESIGKLHNQSWTVEDGLPDGTDLLVDCRGVGASEELLKFGLKVTPNHGDVLTMSTPTEGLDTAGCNVNNGKWLLPIGEREGRMHWRLGATYSWHRQTPSPDSQAPAAIRDHMAQAFNAEGQHAFAQAQLESHDAGLRPASPDRRPMVGPWPGQPTGIAMLNGLGTRGVLVGPMASHWLVEWWLNDAEIPQEMRSNRFKGFPT